MSIKEKYGQTALVAGASEGIGAAFCRALAAEGLDIIMIARRKEPLEREAEHLRTTYKVKVSTIACDLADAHIVETIQQQIGKTAIDVFVYNAALPYIGPYLDANIEDQLRITTVNIQTPMRLLHHFGGAMVRQGRGGFIQMASIAGFQGSGFLTAYATTKAADRVLAESLWYEWRDKGVDVIACCAGATSTPNYINTKPDKLSFLAPKVQSPDEVVKECLQKLGKVPSFVSGSGNKVATFFMKLMPRKMAVKIMGDSTRKMYKINY